MLAWQSWSYSTKAEVIRSGCHQLQKEEQAQQEKTKLLMTNSPPSIGTRFIDSLASSERK